MTIWHAWLDEETIVFSISRSFKSPIQTRRDSFKCWTSIKKLTLNVIFYPLIRQLPPSEPVWVSSKSAHWFKANIRSIEVLVFNNLKPTAVSSLSVSLIIKSTNFSPVIFITWHSGDWPPSSAFLASARSLDLKGTEVLQTVAGYTLVVITFSISMHFMLWLMLFMSCNWK